MSCTKVFGRLQWFDRFLPTLKRWARAGWFLHLPEGGIVSWRNWLFSRRAKAASSRLARPRLDSLEDRDYPNSLLSIGELLVNPTLSELGASDRICLRSPRSHQQR